MKDFLSIFMNEVTFEATGDVSGNIVVSGIWDELHLKGHLTAFDGRVGSLAYEAIDLSAEGIYPKIYIGDSTIIQDDGVIFSFKGPFNLKDKENFKKQIAALTKEPVINADGKKLEWTFKRVRSKDDAFKTELKYLFKKNEVGQSGDDGSDMFGVERSLEF
jgi:hypothetical protein